ncbi:hypothetical protein ACQP1V_43195 (plasmid) [Microtetraspora malaysiensis]|uniref:hypothetical protein n=1 Tax=Microtetraspora malaysiensis TaxID=161358 RepID=UPI003D91A423
MSSPSKVPFDEFGGLFRDARPLPDEIAVHWKEPEPFTATIKIGTNIPGGSRPYVTCHDAEHPERLFPMFLTDLIAVIAQCTITEGVVTAVWEPLQRGNNYGLALYDERRAGFRRGRGDE